VAPSKLPKPTEETKDLFASVVPDHPAVSIRPMFGQLSAFVNGNMFMGIFGDDVLVRLPEADRTEVLGAGGSVFEPMAGRPMKEYVVLPVAWRDDPARIREWAARSLDHAEELPPKQPKKNKPEKPKKP
jgi:TfoX/Sxy family transcriptional regulator of competence genes